MRAELDGVHAAREAGLAASRRTIRAASGSIRATHRGQVAEAAERLAECRSEATATRDAVAGHPSLAGAGWVHDADKELAEAALTAALVAGAALPGAAELGVGAPAWLNGLAEAASELRRAVLDRLRRGEVAEGERLFAAMEAAYELLTTVDHPDAVTGGLRRSTDALRAVLERTRSDLTTTLVQSRLVDALRNAGGGPVR